MGLDEDDREIIRKEKINGRAFFKLTEEKLMQDGMKRGPASNFADFVKECKEKRKRTFSSYRTKKDLKDVLAKYEVQDGRITDILQFMPSKFFHLS